MATHKLRIWRGLFAGLVCGALGFGVPWLFLALIYFANWLGADLDPDTAGAWPGSYFLASMFGSIALVRFGISPRSEARRAYRAVGIVAVVALFLASIVGGRRVKSDPPFGEKPLDILLLTVPAIATAVVILAWLFVRGLRNRSATVEEP